MISFFDADEKRVIEVLKEAGGSMLQKEITWKTGYSKVKTHRIVHRLAKRGILEVEKYFNTNKVRIKNNLLGEPNNIGE
ncbi:MAG: helix-turn-helix transcriptional regulator [Nitrososphaerales archaeon]